MRTPWAGNATLAALVAAALLSGMQPARSADANVDAEVMRVQAALRQVDLAQQGVYQQFQMVQELRRNAIGAPDPAAPPAYGIAPPPGNYEDLQRQREQRQQRADAYQQELERLYRRFQELEEQKRPLLDRLNELSR